MRLLISITLLALISICSSLPKHHVVPRQVTQGPSFTKLSSEQIRHLQNKGFGSTIPTVFHTTASYEDEESEEDDIDKDTSVASTQVRRPVYSEDSYYQNAIPVVQARPQPRPQPQPQVVRRLAPQQQFRQQYLQEIKGADTLRGELEEEEEEEKEEPDRLTVLLAQSKFDCTAKNTGYYADEDLECEVFHYCHENAKHSWICPEGFTFHQVHLICMPPGGDNICAKSSQFHFVNEYLYKPINLEEHQSQPNISLKYSDRYYPDTYQSNQYDEEESANYHRKQPIRVGLPQQQQQQQIQPQVSRRPQFAPTIRPETTIGQVFRSPEEVNISLQQRRPQYVAQRYVNPQEEDY